MPDIRRILGFGLVGVVGFMADAGVLLLLLPICGPYVGRLVSFAAAVVVTWLLNRRFTFPDRDATRRPHIELGRYFLAMLSGGAVNWCTYAVILQWLPRETPWPILAVAAGSLAGMAINLLLAQHFVFRPRLE